MLTLFSLCKSEKYSQAGSYFVYRGNDEQRKWKDVYNVNDEEEKLMVEIECKRINDYLAKNNTYKFVGFHSKEQRVSGILCKSMFDFMSAKSAQK